MMAPRWLAFPLFASLAALGFAACTGGASTEASSSSSGAGGSGGTGGGGGDTTSSTAASTGSTMPEAGPLTCKGTYTNVPTGQCDLLAQDCGPGHTCRAIKNQMTGNWTTACGLAPGIKSEGEVCYGEAECRGGLHCVAGRCAPYCCPTSGQPCQGGVCGFTVQIDQAANLYVRACRYSQQCQVLIPDACPSGLDCHIDDFTFGLATCGARSNMAAAEYAPCGFSNDCASMQQCIAAGGDPTHRCYSLCWMTGPKASAPKGLGGCAAGETCTMAPLGIPNLGLCIP